MFMGFDFAGIDWLHVAIVLAVWLLLAAVLAPLAGHIMALNDEPTGQRFTDWEEQFDFDWPRRSGGVHDRPTANPHGGARRPDGRPRSVVIPVDIIERERAHRGKRNGR